MKYGLFPIVFCVLVLCIVASAADEEKPETVYPSGSVEKIGADTITLKDHENKNQAFEIRENTEYFNTYDIDFKDIQTGEHLVIHGRPNREQTALTAHGVTIYTDEERQSPSVLAGWGGRGDSILQNGKVYIEVENKPVEITLKKDGYVRVESIIRKEDIKKGMTVRVKGQVSKKEKWAEDIKVLGKIDGASKRTQPKDSDSTGAEKSEKPRETIKHKSLEIELRPVNSGIKL